MEVKLIETFDFYSACKYICYGHKLIDIEDWNSGFPQGTIRPRMILTPFEDFETSSPDKNKHYRTSLRCLYNILKVKYPTAEKFEFEGSSGKYEIKTSPVNPPYRSLLLLNPIDIQ